MKYVRLLIVSFLLAIICVPFVSPPVYASWWDTDWDYRNVLSFNASTISENLAYFPILVVLNSSRVDFEKIKANGADIRFIDKNDVTELDYEIEYWSDITETAYVWVEVPQVDLGTNYSDYIFMYYGNDAAVDAQDIEGTWDENGANNFVMVQHMDDEPDTSHIVDSTSYSNDGVKKAANEPLEVVGVIGNAQQFDSVDDYINCLSDASLDDLGPLTIEAYVNAGSLGESNLGAITQKAYTKTYLSSTNTFGFHVYYNTTNLSRLASNNSLSFGVNRYLVWTWDGIPLQTNIKIYQNGAEVAYGAAGGNGTVNRTSDAAQNLCIGNNLTSSMTFDGVIDEVRISKVERSTEWLEATYLTETDTFLFYGSEDPPPSITTNAATNVYMNRGTHATLNGTLDSLGGAPSVDVWFQYGETVAYGNTTTSEEKTGTGTFSANLTGLKPDTLYHFRAVGENVDGTTYGSDEAFYLEAYPAYSIGNSILPILAIMALFIFVVKTWREEDGLMPLLKIIAIVIMGLAFLLPIVNAFIALRG